MEYTTLKSLTVSEFLNIRPSALLARIFLSNVKSVCFYTGAVTVAFYVFPALQIKSLKHDSLIGLNLWRITKFPRWILSVVFSLGIQSLVMKHAMPAAVTAPGVEIPSGQGYVPRAFKAFFDVVKGRREWRAPNGGAFVSWQHAITLCNLWVPSLTFNRWLPFPFCRTFFNLKGSNEAAALDEVTVVMTPQIAFIGDVAMFVSDRTTALIRSCVIPKLLNEPYCFDVKSFMRTFISDGAGIVMAYVAIMWMGRLPEIHVSKFTLRPERHVLLIQAVMNVVGSQVVDKILSMVFKTAVGSAPAPRATDPANLTPEEEETLARVQSIFDIKPRQCETAQNVMGDAFNNSPMSASRRVAVVSVLWAAMVISAQEDLKKQDIKAALLQYKNHLLRMDRDISDTVVMRQDSTAVFNNGSMLQASSTMTGDFDVCAVCLSKIAEDQDLIQITHCHHTFHTDCLALWLTKGSQCPCCRFDLGEGKEAAEVEAGENPNELQLRLLGLLDMMGYSVPHTYDFEEWGQVRGYCLRNGISCNGALSLFGDDATVNVITWFDLCIAPLLFICDAYSPNGSLLRSDFLWY